MTTPIVEFPPPTATLIAYLKHELSARGNSVRVGTKYPRGVSGAPFVKVETNGGPEHDFVLWDCQFVISVYDTDGPQAERNALLVKALMLAAPGVVDNVLKATGVGGPDSIGDPDFPDLERYRLAVFWRITALT